MPNDQRAGLTVTDAAGVGLVGVQMHFGAPARLDPHQESLQDRRPGAVDAQFQQVAVLDSELSRGHIAQVDVPPGDKRPAAGPARSN